MIGLGSDKNCVSQTFHRKPIKFCCELGFIWCKGRLWWTGKVKVQLCLSWKKMKVQLRLSAKSWKCTNKLFRVRVTCMFSFRSAPGVAKKGNHCTLPGNLLSQHQRWLPNLHISSALTVPCWLRHRPQVCVNRSPKINNCSGWSWRGADLEPF